MNDITTRFSRQTLKLSNEFWTVELLYEREPLDHDEEEQSSRIKEIELHEQSSAPSRLTLVTVHPSGTRDVCRITGIDGGVLLFSAKEEGRGSCVKLEDNLVIMSLGFSFVCFNLFTQTIQWSLRPDVAEIFEFYNLENDFLLRGELAIHRIDISGTVKWSFFGKDIWVSLDGEREVQIQGDKIRLTDFEGTKVSIDFNGEMVEEKTEPINQTKPNKDWWKFWK